MLCCYTGSFKRVMESHFPKHRDHSGNITGVGVEAFEWEFVIRQRRGIQMLSILWGAPRFGYILLIIKQLK